MFWEENCSDVDIWWEKDFTFPTNVLLENTVAFICLPLTDFWKVDHIGNWRSFMHTWLIIIFFLMMLLHFMDYLIQNLSADQHSPQRQYSYTGISRDLMHTKEQIQSECRTPQTVSHLNLSVYMEAEFDQVSSKQLNNSVQWQFYFTWLVHLSCMWI